VFGYSILGVGTNYAVMDWATIRSPGSKVLSISAPIEVTAPIR
jgi:hypothetical protein